MVCYEVDPEILDYAQPLLSRQNVTIRLADFLLDEGREEFDAIIGNPPYLKHHDMNYPPELFERVGLRCGVKIPLTANAYVLFLLSCVSRLSKGGRLAFLIPAEWSNANFGACVKKLLSEKRILHKVISFCHSKSMFEDAQTTSHVLLIENRDNGGSFCSYHLPPDADVNELSELNANADIFRQNLSNSEMMGTKKWEAILRRGRTQVPSGCVPLSQLASTKRGLATGANNFFLIDAAEARDNGLDIEDLKPCVGKSQQVDCRFSGKDFDRLRTRVDAIWWTFHLHNDSQSRYILKGERDELHKRYLTKIVRFGIKWRRETRLQSGQEFSIEGHYDLFTIKLKRFP